MNVDGSDKRQLTKEEFRLLNQPSWSPDGRFIDAKKHFTTGRSLGTGEVWLYHVSGGAGVPLVKKPNEQHQKELGEPTYAPDGKSIYFTRNVTPGPIFEYAQNSNTNSSRSSATSWRAARSRPPSPASAARSADALARRQEDRLRPPRARALEALREGPRLGEERKIYDDLDQDMQETWAVTGVYPNMAWTPDSRSVVFWAGGKLAGSTATAAAPARSRSGISDTRPVIEALHPQVEVAPDRFATKMPRWASVSPDGRQVVFETLGKLWIKPPPEARRGGWSGATRPSSTLPLWSERRPDDRLRRLDRPGPGADPHRRGRRRRRAPGDGPARAIMPGRVSRPDGRTIVFERGQGGFLTSAKWSENPGIYRVAAAAAPRCGWRAKAAEPQFAASNDRVFMIVSAAGKRQLVSTDLNGEAKHVHSTGELVSDYKVSPDGQYVAFRQNYQAFVMPLMPGTQDVAADAKGGPLPVTKVSAVGAEFIHWSGGGRRLHWSTGPTVYTADTAALFGSAPPAENAPKFQPPATGLNLSMEVAADQPSGTVALTGARIVTMAAADGGIIDDG
jgi:Tol biopolymer transport system component